jgi:hypothetical protein
MERRVLVSWCQERPVSQLSNFSPTAQPEPSALDQVLQAVTPAPSQRVANWIANRGHLTGSQTLQRFGGTWVIDSIGDTVVPLSTKSEDSQPIHPAGEGGSRPVS